MNFKKLLACWLCGCAAVVLAQTTSGVLESGGARIEVLGHSYAGLVPIGARQSRVVVYSLEDVRLAGATSIFVNGTYHASLIGGAYSELCYSPGEVELGARQMQVGQRAKDRPDAITALQLRGGQTHYLRVRERGGRPVLEPVAAAQAERELPAKRLQLHTLSRVAQECVVVNEAVQAEPTPAVGARPRARKPSAAGAASHTTSAVGARPRARTVHAFRHRVSCQNLRPQGRPPTPRPP